MHVTHGQNYFLRPGVEQTGDETKGATLRSEKAKVLKNNLRRVYITLSQSGITRQHSAGTCGGTCTSDNLSTSHTQLISFAFGNIERNMILKERNIRPPKTT